MISLPSRPSTRARASWLIPLFLLAACDDVEPEAASAPTAPHVNALVGDGNLDEGETCDDGNTVAGDGCGSTGVVEAGYLCRVPGQPCSLASLCGNDVMDSGELCDDGNSVDSGNGCSATCDLSACGNGLVESRVYPYFTQEACDDGNRLDGDGCSSLCGLEPGFGCTGAPSRCAAIGIVLFDTGVDDRGHRVATMADPHWKNVLGGAAATLDTRGAIDWPQELPRARFSRSTSSICVYQDVFVPSTIFVAKLRLDVARFNDNVFDGSTIDGTTFTPLVIASPTGQLWQKNVTMRFDGRLHVGLNRLALCNEAESNPPNAFRYFTVDVFDDRCGDGAISVRERCDDGNTVAGDGCSASCTIEAGRVCTGAPSSCGTTCGNGVANAGEQCDDGNTMAGDGCDDRCVVEPGRACLPVGACTSTCGNGVIDAGELCDDGNLRRRDGCSDACRVEPGFACSDHPSICVARCGNGVLDAGELCDDGNARRGDGCSTACTLELGYACAGTVCAPTCGNGQVDPGELCDDGGFVVGDGCNAECAVEAGSACSTPANGSSSCATSCGNGTIDANEGCDDGNVTPGDGCSAACRAEPGFACSGAPSTCATTCGDGLVAGAERCDDGNGVTGDGCVGCAIESGWICSGGACASTCGNGARDARETCDDGNNAAGDGCSPTCTVEAGHACTGSPDVCVGLCGDGIALPTEGCDDGNLREDDGCSTRCLRATGLPCTADAQCEVACSQSTHVCDDDDVAPPAPGITTPVDGSEVLDAKPAIGGTAESDATVTITLDGQTIGSTTATAAGTFEVVPSSPLSLGAHTVTAIATDVVGNASLASAPVVFTIVACLGDGDCVPGVSVCDGTSHTCTPIPTGDDGGVTTTDAGVDAGVTTPRHHGGCSAAPWSTHGSSAAWIAAIALVVLRRRR